MSRSNGTTTITALALALGLAACGNKKDESASAQSGPPASTNPPSGTKRTLSDEEKERASAEAHALIKRIYEGAYGYYLNAKEAAPSSGGVSPVAHFPTPSAGPTPPLGSCCKEPDAVCQPNPADWNKEPWLSIGFSLTEPSGYSIEYTVTNGPTPSAAGAPQASRSSFTVFAYGDLDCDGVYTTFKLQGLGDEPQPAGQPADAKQVPAPTPEQQ